MSFDTPLKGKSGFDHFGTFKKWISVDVTLDFECREKIFFQSSVANICVCKHPEDHSYSQKQTGVSYDDSNRLYDPKREVTVIFEF